MKIDPFHVLDDSRVAGVLRRLHAEADRQTPGLLLHFEIRVGDALETLRELPGQVDLLLNDGFPMLAMDIVKLVAPHMREGAVVLTDNVGTFKANYREYVGFLRSPESGFRSAILPFKSGTEYSVKVGGRGSGESPAS